VSSVQLDSYQKWLRSLPLHFDGEKYSASAKEKLEILEQSVRSQQDQLKRAKELFAADIGAMQQLMTRKNEELAAAERREAALQAQLVEVRKTSFN